MLFAAVCPLAYVVYLHSRLCCFSFSCTRKTFPPNWANRHPQVSYSFISAPLFNSVFFRSWSTSASQTDYFSHILQKFQFEKPKSTTTSNIILLYLPRLFFYHYKAPVVFIFVYNYNFLQSSWWKGYLISIITNFSPSLLNLFGLFFLVSFDCGCVWLLFF